MNQDIMAVVLAAGKGTRMKSEKSKLVHKIYGKEWNGPYHYTEIGNYGDTTNFYIIGLLQS